MCRFPSHRFAASVLSLPARWSAAFAFPEPRISASMQRCALTSRLPALPRQMTRNAQTPRRGLSYSSRWVLTQFLLGLGSYHDLARAGPVEITSESAFDAQVGASSLPTLVEFFAPWCKACASFAPVLHEVAAQLEDEQAGGLRLVRVDGDSQPALRLRFRIEEAPTLLLFAALQPADRANALRYDGPLEKAPLLAWARVELARLQPPAPPQPRAQRAPTPDPEAIADARAFTAATVAPEQRGEPGREAAGAASAAQRERAEAHARVSGEVMELAVRLLVLLRERRATMLTHESDRFARVDAALITALEQRELIGLGAAPAEEASGGDARAEGGADRDGRVQQLEALLFGSEAEPRPVPGGHTEPPPDVADSKRHTESQQEEDASAGPSPTSASPASASPTKGPTRPKPRSGTAAPAQPRRPKKPPSPPGRAAARDGSIGNGGSPAKGAADTLAPRRGTGRHGGRKEAAETGGEPANTGSSPHVGTQAAGRLRQRTIAEVSAGGGMAWQCVCRRLAQLCALHAMPCRVQMHPCAAVRACARALLCAAVRCRAVHAACRAHAAHERTRCCTV